MLIQNIECEIPKQPPLSSIDGAKRKPKDQYFRRTVIPAFMDTVIIDENWNLCNLITEGGIEKKLPLTHDQIKFIEQEIDRCVNGYWFMRKGEPTWCPGRFYYFLNYWTTEDGAGYASADKKVEYRTPDLKFFTFYESCSDDPIIKGIVRGKKVREGATTQGTCISAHTAAFYSDQNCGTVSDTGLNAKTTFTKMIIRGFFDSPIWLQPRYDNSTNTKGKLTFVKPTIKQKGNVVHTRREGNNSEISWQNTSMSAYVNARLSYVLVDECLHPDTKIMCEGFVFKAIKDVNIGDKVIIEGGILREVVKKTSGETDMYLIRQPYSSDYIVSENHRLYLEQRCKHKSFKDDGIKTYTPGEFLKLNNYRKRTTFGLRSSGIEMAEQQLFIDAYVFGAWIGDGRNNDASFVCYPALDPEIYEHLIEYGNSAGYKITEHWMKSNDKICLLNYRMPKMNNRTGNPFIVELKRLKVHKNKHIPECYLYNTKENRLKLLAGIIDTDGYLSKKGSIEIAMSSEVIINQISFLCKSLGFSVSRIRHRLVNSGHSKIKKNNSYRINIYGDLSQIPCKIKRKQTESNSQKYKFRRNRIEVIPIGKGNYVGIQVNGVNDNERRLILEDFTLTLNSGRWKEIDIYEYWNTNLKERIVRGASKTGFAYFPTAVNPPNEGGRNFSKLWIASDQHSYTGKHTSTGLVRWFMPAWEGYSGFIDRYGDSVIEPPDEETLKFLIEKQNELPKKERIPVEDLKLGAKKYLERQRDVLRNDPEALSAHKRNYPFVEADMFDFGDLYSPFNLDKVKEQIAWLRANPDKNFWRRGRLVPHNFSDNGRPGINVQWHEDSHGNWFVREFPKRPNAFTIDDYGIVRPAATDLYGGGMDTVRFDETKELSSNAVIMIGSKLDISKPEEQEGGYEIAFWSGRPKLTELIWKEMLLAELYWGCTVSAERDATQEYIKYHKNIIPNFMDRNCLPMLGKKPDMAIDPQRKPDKKIEYGASSADKFVRAKQTEVAQVYIEKYVQKMRLIILLEKILEFNPDYRTPSDEVIAWMMMLLNICGDFRQRAMERKVLPMIEQYEVKRYR